MAQKRGPPANPSFPRSSQYDDDWMMDNQMGPNAVWLVEWLCESMHIGPGMRVLDLGCGRAMTSVFLAKEFGARVWASDLWMSPHGNWERVKAAGVQDLVCPLHLEAHALPFAEGYFDAVVSIDAYQYFGTDALYLSYLAQFVRPGGQIGVVVPGLMQEIEADSIPAHLTEPQSNGKVFWEDDCFSFLTAPRWKQLFMQWTKVHDVTVDALADGWKHWRDFEFALEAAGKGIFPSDAEALAKDGGRFIGFVRVRATRSEQQGMM